MLSLAEIQSVNEKQYPSVAVMSFEPKPEGASIPWVEMPRDAKPYSQLLYATLRGLDVEGVQLILVETLPMLPEWEAVQDRLKRAAAPRPA
jgi:L-threonylcarbamoyladenylate synthase